VSIGILNQNQCPFGRSIKQSVPSVKCHASIKTNRCMLPSSHSFHLAYCVLSVKRTQQRKLIGFNIYSTVLTVHLLVTCQRMIKNIKVTHVIRRSRQTVDRLQCAAAKVENCVWRSAPPATLVNYHDLLQSVYLSSYTVYTQVYTCNVMYGICVNFVKNIGGVRLSDRSNSALQWWVGGGCRFDSIPASYDGQTDGQTARRQLEAYQRLLSRLYKVTCNAGCSQHFQH